MQERTRLAQDIILRELAKGVSMVTAAETADVVYQSLTRWRTEFPDFGEKVAKLIKVNRYARAAATAARRKAKAEGTPTLNPSTERPDRLGLKDFRMAYFGRPTPKHHQAAVKALEDPSNLYVFIFGPTGMGKDTLAGDYVAWEAAPDTTGRRVAWFMESENFAARRLNRLGRYLTDPKAYDHRPNKTPGGQVPTRSLIDDYGPFRWEKNMHHPDGVRVERTQWDRLVKYFVQVKAPEQDPNLWATGVGGATYGSRIDVCVLSDVFTLENQKSPAVRIDQYAWVEGTLDTRLDEDGRLVVIGTMLPVENNYERMLVEYTQGARVLEAETIGGAAYTKYSNGVAVVIVKAIQHADDSSEISYWPERFPLDTIYRYKSKAYREEDLSTERMLEMTSQGATLVRGLRWRRQRSPAMFKAMYQQERDTETGGDFTEETLKRSRNPERSFGRAYPHELVVLGVDPARRYGAAWVTLAIDRREQIITVCDFFFGDNLGVTGIKQRLILEPLAKWNPIWLIYEDNIESAVLDDTTIKEAIRESGVSVDTIHTGRNRVGPMVGEVGSIAAWMRTGNFLIPYRTADDRARYEILSSHFKAWDSSSVAHGRRTGRSGKISDDLAMAARAAFLKARDLIDKGHQTSWGQSIGVPAHIQRKFDRIKKQRQASKAEQVRRKPTTAEELITSFVGGEVEVEGFGHKG